MTRIAVDLGLGDQVVGRTGYCTAVDADVPVIGDLHAIDFETLIRLQPDVVCVQPPSTGVNAQLREMARTHGWTLVEKRLNTLDDIAVCTTALAEAAAMPRATARAAELSAELHSLAHDRQQPVWPGRVLMLARVDPPLAFANETFLDTMLESLGAQNAAHGRGWIELTVEDVVRLDPQAMLLVQPRAAMDDETVEPVLGPLAEVELAAVNAGRVAVLSHPDALLPSTALIEVQEELEQILAAWAREEDPP